MVYNKQSKQKDTCISMYISVRNVKRKLHVHVQIKQHSSVK